MLAAIQNQNDNQGPPPRSKADARAAMWGKEPKTLEEVKEIASKNQQELKKSQQAIEESCATQDQIHKIAESHPKIPLQSLSLADVVWSGRDNVKIDELLSDPQININISDNRSPAELAYQILKLRLGEEREQSARITLDKLLSRADFEINLLSLDHLQETLFVRLLRIGEVDIVNKMLERDDLKLYIKHLCFTNLHDYQSGKDALIYAMEGGYFDIAEKILKKQGIGNISKDNLEEIATESGGDFKKMISALKAKGLKIDSKAPNLILALKNNDKAGFKLFLYSNYAGLNSPDDENKNILMHAIQSGKKEFLELILERDHLILYNKDNSGKTALVLAAEKGDPEIVKMMLDKRSKMPEEQKKDPRDPWRSYQKDLQEAYIAVNSKNQKVKNLLMEAAKKEGFDLRFKVFRKGLEETALKVVEGVGLTTIFAVGSYTVISAAITIAEGLLQIPRILLGARRRQEAARIALNLVAAGAAAASPSRLENDGQKPD